MTEKELRKLGRAELLELLLEQTREFEALEQRLNAAEAALQSRQPYISLTIYRQLMRPMAKYQ